MRKTGDWDGEVGDGIARIGKHILKHPDHVNFVAACRKANLKPYFYQGRYLYRGPAVTLPNVTAVSSFGIDMPMVWDNLGKEYVVHPQVSINESEKERIEAMRFLHGIQSRCSD